jgi:hypothetical protein
MNIFSKAFLCILAGVIFIGGVVDVSAQTRYPRASQKAMVMQTVGDTDVTITYHRPNINERKLFGSQQEKALVPYGEVWRAGANEATVFEVTNDVSIEGQKLPKGKYGFYAIPGNDEWTLIFNKTWDQWGTIYDESKDALRVKVKPATADEPFESMAYLIRNVSANTADVILAWGTTRVPFKLDVGDVNARLFETVNRHVTSERLNAANYILTSEQKDRYATAVGWLDALLAGGQSYNALEIKARLQAAMGMKKEALETGRQAIEFGKANNVNPRNIAFLEGLMKEWSGE